MPLEIADMLKILVERKASDLHIGVNTQPHIRIDERIVSLDAKILGAAEVKEMVYKLLSPDEIKRFEAEKELDRSFEIKGLSRFRMNVFFQRGNIGTAIRTIPYKIMSFAECGLPVKVITELSRKPKGLVLVTGATGSGKSTTLASIVDKINEERPCHMITVEDPIEFIHDNKMAIIDQREIGADTKSFAKALKHVLRQDPDVILIGEMRDLETIEAALTIAETGHLVFATLHTSDVVQTINRIIDVFPSHQQQQVRTQLSFILQGILAQQLIPKVGGTGRLLASEVMVATPAIRSLIREEKVHQIYSIVQTGQKEGMRTMNQSIYDLYVQKHISYEEAISRSTDPDDLIRLFKR
ncbi:MAG: type IV pilus twitching motility protein PilT [Candidatus Omnitrophica bacterium]|nr:type IV pilus twitching motility protein PilT [Candidatus Omnitrophota bacterium]MBU1925817.1 type IV pilus twitching motility protein PilT [Candidatus Omnitrophota bacterium]MBU2063620.1 type IV pilus twitching motility protein PilT [Candidatus Omnitrophota bacterium]